MPKQEKRDMTVAEAGRKGGEVVKERYGSEFYQRIGRKGGSPARTCPVPLRVSTWFQLPTTRAIPTSCARGGASSRLRTETRTASSTSSPGRDR